MAIHPTAIIDPAARIHPDADIGPEIFATPAALSAYVSKRLG